MQLLLRKMLPDASGQIEYSDRELDTDEILIGSSPECDIQILGEGIAPRHARLRRSGKQNQLRAESGQPFLHNGKPVRKATLQAGDQLAFGVQPFSVAEPPGGFDLALEWHAVTVEGHWLAGAYRTSLDDLAFSPRRLSWWLVALILIGAGLAPVLHYFWMSPGNAEQAVSQTLTPEHFWLSGPLLSAHQIAIGNNCSVCHEAAFVQVQDKACESCHTNMAGHVAVDHPDVAGFDGFACQNCHKEHNEPASIVPGSDALCSDCHQSMEPAADGFSQQTHPEFAPTLLQPDVAFSNGGFAVNWTHEKVPDAAKESSHLKFPHDVHLDGDKVSHDQRGDALVCADCHQLSPDREHFEPVTMTQHCSSCHELSFDRNFPQKQLPHGEPSEVYAALEAHFVGVAFGTIQADQFERRRLPAREWQDEKCDQDFACAQRQALREAEQQFMKSGCITCHEVKEVPKAERSERWQVLPVRLNDDWFAEARFDHQSHLTQAGLSGDAVCQSCHEAGNSKVSADILMPELAQCTDCHGDASVPDRVPLNCIACHAYHLEGKNNHRDSTHSAAPTSLLKGAADATP